MKKYLFIVLLVGAWSCGESGVDFQTLIDKNGMVYVSESSGLFTGRVYKKYFDNKTEFEGNYLDGKKTGLWSYWYEDGSKKLEGNYLNNSFNGVWKYWDKNSSIYYEGKIIDYDIDIFPINTNDMHFLLWDNNDQDNITIKFHGSFGDGMKTFWDSKGNLLVEGKTKGQKPFPLLENTSKEFLESKIGLEMANLLQFIAANLPVNKYFEIERKFLEFSNFTANDLNFKNINVLIEKILENTTDDYVKSYVQNKLVEIFSYGAAYSGGSLKIHRKIDDWVLYNKNGSVAETLSFNSALSEYSQNVLDEIYSDLTIKAFFSENLPGQLESVKMNLRELLKEYRYTSSKINFKFLNPQTDKNFETEADGLGLKPVKMQVVELEKLKIKKVYLGLSLKYKDKTEIIQVIQNKIGIEYLITSKIKNLINKNKNKNKKTVGIADLTSNKKLKMENLVKQLKVSYNVKNVDLSKPGSLSSDIDALLVSGATDTVNATTLLNLNKFLKSGRSIFFSQGGVSTNMQTQQAVNLNSNIFSFLQSYGFKINQNLVLDKSCGRVQVQKQVGFMRANVPMEYPFLPIIRNFNGKELVVSGIEQIHLFFPSQIELSNKNIRATSDYNVSQLFTSSDSSALMYEPYLFSPDPKINSIFNKLNQNEKVVAAISKIKPKGEIILVSDSKFLFDNAGMSIPENIKFIMNVIDYLTSEKDQISLKNATFENYNMSLKLQPSLPEYHPPVNGYIEFSQEDLNRLAGSNKNHNKDDSIEDELKKLKSLLDQGLISKNQYKKKSDKLLGL
jgi:hypothetical protein